MELFDIVDEHGIPTGETVERSQAHAQGIWHRTSHLWIVRRRSDNGALEILLQKRCMDKDSFPGCWDISSAGHIPAGCGHEESAIRELKEELGIDAGEEQLIYCGSRKIEWDDEFHGIEYHDRQFTKVYMMWLDFDEDAFTLQKEEVEQVKWFDFKECIEAVKRTPLMGGDFRHCIELEELMMVYNSI